MRKRQTYEKRERYNGFAYIHVALDVSTKFLGSSADKEREKKKKNRDRASEKEKAETKTETKRLSEQTKEKDLQIEMIRRSSAQMMAWRGAEDRCEEVCRCHHPSGDPGRPVQLYRLRFKRTPMMDTGGD